MWIKSIYSSPAIYLRSFLFFILLALYIFRGEGVAEEYFSPSKRIIIEYQDRRQLERFARKIRPGAFTRTLNRIFLGSGGVSSTGDVGELADRLFKRVQLILDMPQPKLKVRIRIHPNQERLSRAYARIMGSKTKAPAFYWKKTNVIHVQTKRLSMGILAHEMGHAVIDHYFIIRPPPKIAEMLCGYVDKEISAGNF